MPARVYIVDNDEAEIAGAVLRLNRDRCRLVSAVQADSGRLVLLATDDNPGCEVRPNRTTDMVTRVEKPDTHGGAARPIDEEVIAERSARWDDPA